LDNSTLVRKEFYNHLTSKHLVHDIILIENNSNYCLKQDLLLKILIIQRTLRKFLFSKQKTTKKKKDEFDIIKRAKKDYEANDIEKEHDNINNNSTEDNKSELRVRVF